MIELKIHREKYREILLYILKLGNGAVLKVRPDFFQIERSYSGLYKLLIRLQPETFEEYEAEKLDMLISAEDFKDLSNIADSSEIYELIFDDTDAYFYGNATNLEYFTKNEVRKNVKENIMPTNQDLISRVEIKSAKVKPFFEIAKKVDKERLSVFIDPNESIFRLYTESDLASITYEPQEGDLIHISGKKVKKTVNPNKLHDVLTRIPDDHELGMKIYKDQFVFKSSILDKEGLLWISIPYHL